MKTHKIFYSAKPIGSIAKLATALDFTEGFLRRVSTHTADYYTEFVKPVKGKDRELCEPKPNLKNLQKRINTRIFSHIKFPLYLHGGIKTTDPRDFVSNASQHCKSETAIALDIKGFFPSITTAQVHNVFKNLLNFPDDVSALLANIVTLNGSLPQGAPTSSYISNLVMWEKEFRLVSKLEGRGLIYTRLIDDMTISSKSRIPEKLVTKIIEDVAGMLKHYDYTLHPEKKKIFSKSDPKHLMLITGLWLNRGAPKILKEKREEISQGVIEAMRMASKPNTLFDPEYHAVHATCSGKVALLQRLGHTRAMRLRNMLNSVQPQFSPEYCHKISVLVRKFCAKGKVKSDLGNLKIFYNFQYKVSIVKRTDPILAKKLQTSLNSIRPQATMRELNG